MLKKKLKKIINSVLIVFLIFAFGYWNTAFADITYDAVSSGKGQVDPLSWAHTNTTQSNRLLLVCINNQSNTVQPVSVKYNDVAMTQVNNINNLTDHNTSLYYLVNPDTGTHNIVIDQSDVYALTATAISLYGVDVDTPLGNKFAIADTTADQVESNNVNTTTDNAWVVDCLMTVANATVGADQTDRVVANYNTYYVQMSTEPKATAGTVTMSWTWGINGISNHLATVVNMGAVATEDSGTTMMIGDFVYKPEAIITV